LKKLSKKDKRPTFSQSEAIPFIRPKRLALPWWKRFGNVCRCIWNDLRSQCSRNPLDRCRWIRLASSLKNVSDKPKDQLARAGEEEAVFLLREKGYIILQQNIRFPEGELDIAAKFGSTLVFLEVKTRRDRKYGEPSEAVKAAKRRSQIIMAQRFLAICRLSNVPIRFDIISIYWAADAPPKIKHIENAFQINE
jgi:putative endonuclease